MGYRLRREVRNMLPKGLLTHKEVRLLLEIADSCNDDTRRGWPGVDALADIADLGTAKKVGETLASIASKWIEIREETGKDRSGKPTYTHRGRRTVFRFPTRAELAHRNVTMAPQNRGPLTPESSPETGDQSTEMLPCFGVESPPETGEQSGLMVPQNGGPLSSRTSSSSSPQAAAPAEGVSQTDDDEDQQRASNTTVAKIADATGRPVAEAEDAYRQIAALPNVRSIARLVDTLIDNGDIASFIRRPEPTVNGLADQIAALRRGPECDHDVPGGASTHPATGEPLCPSCRARARRAKAGAA